MAFGKKKDEQAPADAAAEAAEPEGSLEDAFAGGVEAPAEADAPALEAPAAEEPTAEAPAPDAIAGGADSLLSAFSDSQIETEDNSMIVELAGEHDIDDLLEELHTVASALCIVMDEDEAAA